jgi:hypothetical protein
MFIDDAHILQASSSTVWAWTSKRPAIARISSGRSDHGLNDPPMGD